MKLRKRIEGRGRVGVWEGKREGKIEGKREGKIEKEIEKEREREREIRVRIKTGVKRKEGEGTIRKNERERNRGKKVRE